MRAVSQDACENDAQLEAQRRDRIGHVTLRARVRQFSAPEFVHPQWNQSLSGVI